MESREMVPMILFEDSKGDTHMKDRLLDTVRDGESEWDDLTE